MAEILDSLCRDHRDLAGLLDIADRQFMVLVDTGEIDWEIIELILRYSRGYADMCHHPIEDLLYDLMVARDVLVADFVEDLHTEHRDLAAATHHLHQAVGRARTGESAPDDKILSDARTFLITYRRHMSMEETVLFATARDALSAGDWRELDRQRLMRVDANQAAAATERFDAMRDRIHRQDRSGRVNVAVA